MADDVFASVFARMRHEMRSEGLTAEAVNRMIPRDSEDCEMSHVVPAHAN